MTPLVKVVKGKAEKSLYKINAINREIDDMKGILDDVKKRLEKVIRNENNYLGINADLTFNTELINSGIPEKQKYMIESLPERVEFSHNYLKFYIDFTLTQGDDASADIAGCMIYGVNRNALFKKSLIPLKPAEEVKSENGTNVSWSIRLEDKPLIQFSIDQHKMIQSAGEFEDSWWIEKEDDLPEIHFRTMELIWPKALAWINENHLA